MKFNLKRTSHISMGGIGLQRRLLAIILLCFFLNFSLFTQKAVGLITAGADSYNTSEDTTLIVGTVTGVLSNDNDSEDDPLTIISLISDVTHGTLVLNTDGSFTYTPNPNFNGMESFVYEVDDDDDLDPSSYGTVDIMVTAVNDAPSFTGGLDQSVLEDAGAQTVSAWASAISPGPANEAGQSLTFNVSNDNNALFSDQPAVDSATGNLTFTPAPDVFGTASVTVVLQDDGGGTETSAPHVFSITVNAVQDLPVADNDAYTTDEDTALNVLVPGVLDGDTDADGEALTAVLVSDVSNGTLSLNADGSFTYTPDADFNGADSFTYKANDGTADSNVATVSITVNAVQDLPVADNDAYTTDEDTALNVPVPGVLDGDTDADGEALTAVLVSDVSNGTLSLNADGSFTYTPDADFNGADSFTYKANDGTADSNVATVSITVNAVQDLPVADNDAYTTDEDTALNVPVPGVLDGDTDADGEALTAVLVSDVSNGTLSLNADGSFTYTPDADFNGADSFTYKANDGTADSNVATVSITVNAVQDLPVADNDAYTTDEDTALNVPVPGVLDGDTDADGEALTAVLVSDVSNGTLSLNADGSFTYTPDADFNGADSFTYKANDGTADSNVATVSITVNAVQDLPVADNDAYTTDEDTALNVPVPGVLDGDTDADGEALTAVLVSDVSNGTLSLNADGSFTYTPDADFNGADSFTYKANDGTADSNVATVSITVNAVQDLPVADNDAYTTDEDTALNVPVPGVLDGDTDADGEALTAVLVSDVSNGTLSLNADGSFTYTPDADFNGADSFTYKANDGTADSNVATVSITVNAVQDLPVADNDAYTTDEDTALNVPVPGVLDGDTDADGEALTAVLVSDVSNGTLSLNADGSFTYTPDADFNGADSFTYKANDGTADSNVATVSITVNAVQDLPVADNDAYTTDEDTALNVPVPGVLDGDTDADGEALTAVLVSDVSNGTLSLNADGSFTYTPDADFNGADSFTYKANDGTADSNVATVSITVNAVHDLPVADNDAYTTDEDTALNVPVPGVLDGDTDADGEALTAVLVSDVSNGTLTLNADGSFTYTPNADFNGADSFTYKANDGTADSNVATVSITVNAVNDLPVVDNDAYTTDEDTALNVPVPGVLDGDTDADGDALYGGVGERCVKRHTEPERRRQLHLHAGCGLQRR